MGQDGIVNKDTSLEVNSSQSWSVSGTRSNHKIKVPYAPGEKYMIEISIGMAWM